MSARKLKVTTDPENEIKSLTVGTGDDLVHIVAEGDADTFDRVEIVLSRNEAKLLALAIAQIVGHV